MKLNKKGFTLVELLAVITILGILMSVAIGAVSWILESAKDNFYKTLEKNILLTAETYYSDHRASLPKNIGQKAKIGLQALVNSNYIKKDEIVDYGKQQCDITSSFVVVTKKSKKDYSYELYLKCPSKTIGDPSIGKSNSSSITIGASISHITKAMTITGSGVISYQYTVYRNNLMVYNSSSISVKEAGFTDTVDLSKYSPGSMKVVVTAYSSSGGSKTVTSNIADFQDSSSGNVLTPPNSFPTDSWDTIISAVHSGNTSSYHVGDTKTINMGSFGNHTIRIANTSTPDECATDGFSQTACGFVLEFADIITNHNMNSGNTNVGGWPASEMYTYVQNDIYNALPSELKAGIIETTVVSGHGSSDSANFTSTDKLYLLSTKEVWGKEGTSNVINNDTTDAYTRQLDYYKAQGVTTSNKSGAIKQYNGSNTIWWLRAASSNYSNYFYTVMTLGDCYDISAYNSIGVAPAFRIG